MPDRELAEIAACQHGLITRAQALEQLSVDQLRHRIADGRFVRVHRAVYRIAGAPQTWRQRLHAVCLAAGSGAVASHRAAAALWRMRVTRDRWRSSSQLPAMST